MAVSEGSDTTLPWRGPANSVPPRWKAFYPGDGLGPTTLHLFVPPPPALTLFAADRLAQSTTRSRGQDRTGQPHRRIVDDEAFAEVQPVLGGVPAELVPRDNVQFVLLAAAAQLPTQKTKTGQNRRTFVKKGVRFFRPLGFQYALLPCNAYWKPHEG